MQVHLTPGAGTNSTMPVKFSRRSMLAGGIAGSAAFTLPVSSAADDLTDSPVLRLIDAYEDVVRQAQAYSQSIPSHPEHTKLHSVSLFEIDPERYSGARNRDDLLYTEVQIRAFFNRQKRLGVVTPEVLAAYEKQEAAALAMLSERLETYRRWDVEHGRSAMLDEDERLGDQMIRAYHRIALFRCVSYADVVAKLTFIHKGLDGESLTVEFATAILLTTAGIASDYAGRWGLL